MAPSHYLCTFAHKCKEMFGFWNKKTFLRDLIPDGHIDIHCHVLPGIDDGAANPEEALFLMESLRKLGFAHCIATPHIMGSTWENNPQTIAQAHQKLMNASQNAFSVGYAAEYMIDPNFTKLYQNEELLTLKDRYVLVEISYLNPPVQLFDIFFELQVAGYQPILAHPERYIYFHKKFEQYQKIKNAGVHLQLNLLSTVGYYGPVVAQAAQKLLRAGLIDFVGSDVHHERHLQAFDQKLLWRDTQPLKEVIARNQLFRP